MSVFVGNISQQAAEDDLHWLFSQVGAVRRVRLPLDKESGKHRSFGFVDFHDEGTMQAAIVRMDGMELKGRALRVNAAETGPRGGAARHGGVNPGDGGGVGAHYGGAVAAPMQEGYGAACPPGYGAACPPGYGAVCPPAVGCGGGGGDQTSGMSDMELWDIVAQMKEMVDKDVDQARRNLTQNPAMAMAVLRAQVQLGMVTPHSIAAVMSKAQAQQPPPASPQPPPPQQQQQPQPILNPQQQALMQQVMQLTQEQIDQLPADQRDQLLMLRQQVMSGQYGA